MICSGRRDALPDARRRVEHELGRAVGGATGKKWRGELAVSRQIQHLARSKLGPRIGVAAGVLSKLVNERKKDRL